MKSFCCVALAVVLFAAIPNVACAKSQICRVIAKFQISPSKTAANPRQELADACERIRDSVKSSLGALMTVTNIQDTGSSSRFMVEAIGEWTDSASWPQSGEKVDEALASVATGCSSQAVEVTVRAGALCK